MTTPTPTAQDGEQLDLRCDETKFWHAQLAERDETIRQREELHHEDVARNVRLVANVLSLEDQLAALRAQVERVRALRDSYEQSTDDECMCETCERTRALVKFMDAALATPQPVAKEK